MAASQSVQAVRVYRDGELVLMPINLLVEETSFYFSLRYL